jgi:hypothetical protein
VTVYFVSPNNESEPSGGAARLYRYAEFLQRAGSTAAVVQGVRGYRPPWFASTASIVYPPVALGPGDILVFPEFTSQNMLRAAPGIPRVCLNQNQFLTYFDADPEDEHPVTRCRDLVAVIATSAEVMRYLDYAFPGTRIFRVRYAPLSYHYVEPGPRPRQISWMPRKRERDAALILGALRNRGSLAGWTLAPIDGSSEKQAAAVMRQSAVFLSLSREEGFGLPPLEALACGCKVIGYHGIGGREFFEEPFVTTIEDGDNVAFAEAVERYVESYVPDAAAEFATDAAAYVASRYTAEQEEADVVAAFEWILDEAKQRPPRRGVLHASETWVKPPWSRREMRYWRVVEGVALRLFRRTRSRSL